MKTKEAVCWKEMTTTTNAAVALEIRQEWMSLILDGSKTVEVRQYPLPPDLLHQKVYLLQSPSPSNAATNKSQVPDKVELVEQDSLSLVGWCRFDSVRQYTSQQAFREDQSLHRIPDDHPLGWPITTHEPEKSTLPLYGWHIASLGTDVPDSIQKSSLHRRFRSLFEIQESL